MRRRQFLKNSLAGTLGLASAGLAIPTAGAASNRGNRLKETVFVFVHGSNHNAAHFTKVNNALAAKGYGSEAIDLPGHGLDADFPASYFQRPIDPSNPGDFGTEASPIAHITLADYANHTANIVKDLARKYRNVILVGHSLGGLTISAVAEQVPRDITKLVYLTSVAAAPGSSFIDVLSNVPSFADSLGGLVGVGDPGASGAARIDPRTTDSDYKSLLRQAYYHDISDAEFEAALSLLTPDEPFGVYFEITPATPARWGRVPRAWIRCSQDAVVTPTMSNDMAALLDETTPHNQTEMYDIDTSHSSFLSKPEELAALLISIS